jgi:PAS domain S-box-containing protein
VVGGSLALIGWATSRQWLTDWRRDGVSMLPNTALCAVLSGLILLFHGRYGRSRLLALPVALIGGATLLEHLSSLSFGIDDLLFYREWGQGATVAPMRMGPPAAVSFLLLGAALLLLHARGRLRGLAAALGVVVSVIALLSVIGFVYGATQMYRVPHVTGIALPTALILLALGSGLIASLPDREPMRSLIEGSAAGMLARRALPTIILVWVVLGWARVFLVARGVVDRAFGSALRTLVEVLVLNVLLFFAVRMVRRHEKALQESETEIRHQARQLAAFLDTAAICLHRVGPDGVILWANDAELQTFGYAHDEYVGHPLSQFHADPEVCREMLARLHAGHTLHDFEARMVCRDGSIKTVLIDSSALRDDGHFVHTQCFTRDITAAKRDEAALLEAKEAAEAASVAKDNFVATLSHELRTPLTPVLATLSGWEEAIDHLPEQFRDDLRTMRRNVDLEARLIDDLLDLTRIVKGKLALSPDTLDVHRLLQAVVRMYASELEARSLKLTLRLEATRHVVRGDPGRLQQVFWNVLKNAAKFTPERGRIDLSTRNDAHGRLVIAVRDNGCGISKEALAKLFRPFEQGSDEVVRQYGGLGLGLTISSALLTAHGGDISASSEGPGHGATFTMTLPVLADARTWEPETLPVPQCTREGRRFRLLLVEDHLDTAKVLARLLRGNGHEVETAASLREARHAFATGRFDFLVSDVGLPDGSGIDLIREIRERYGPTLPAVALSGFGMEDDVARCRQAGFDDHLTKPVNLQKLEATIQRVGAMKATVTV